MNELRDKLKKLGIDYESFERRTRIYELAREAEERTRLEEMNKLEEDIIIQYLKN
ncbi:MAG: hypothetical protein WC812_03250 [Candidatus Pacearchaeota archaeon]|jgi:hypothetical protein